jgi:hypothetical protein
MNGKQAKRLRKYAKRFKENYSDIKAQFKGLPSDGRRKLAEHISDWMEKTI